MSTSAIVGLVGLITTAAVGLAGYWFNQRRAADDRQANRELAEDSHRHERELAEQARAHERQLRKSEREYQDRRSAYRLVTEWALRTTQQVLLTVPLLKTSDTPEPPEKLNEVEYRAMLVEVALFGSPAVSDEMEAFKKKTDVFGSRLVGWRLQREQLATELESGVLFEDLQDAREEVVTAYTQLTALIHDELAGL